MQKLKIGYWPLSQNLDTAGDRRRLIFWAQVRGHVVTTDLNQNVDVVVASENSDFNSPYFSKKRVPVIFDLVDAYLSPQSLSNDLARGIAKYISGQISGGVRPFSHHIRDFCLSSSAVICSSIEQEQVIQRYNSNTHVILDSHDEIPFVDVVKVRPPDFDRCRILWEGQPATIRGVKNVSSVLDKLSKYSNLSLDFVTDEKYYRLLNKYFERNTTSLVKKVLAPISEQISVTPWTPKNLVESAKGSDIAMIPIDLSVPMQRLKPENRLLIMWRLGLPCLTSPSPAYVRVGGNAGLKVACDNSQEWIENIDRLLKEPGYAKSVVESGQNYIREKHTRTALLNKWDLVFESVMG